MSDAPMQSNSPDDDLFEGSAYGEGSFQPSSNEFHEGAGSDDLSAGSPFDSDSVDDAMDENSWLLEEAPDAEEGDVHGDVPALPDEFATGSTDGDAWSGEGESVDGAGAEYGVEEDLVGASYVEPESASQIVSRALVPGVSVLLLSFGGIAVWASLNKEPDQIPTEPNLAALTGEVEVVEDRAADDELVVPVGAGGSQATGRMGYQRDGTLVSKGDAPSLGSATVDVPREPGELGESEDERDASDRDGASNERTSFSGFGLGEGSDAPEGAPAEAPTDVPKADDESEVFDPNEISIEVNDYVDATEFELESEDQDGETVELSQSFLDSFVLEIEPIESEAVEPQEEVADLTPVEATPDDVAAASQVREADDQVVGVEETSPVHFAPGFEQVFPEDPGYDDYSWAFPTLDATPVGPDQSASADDEGGDTPSEDETVMAEAIQLPFDFDADDPDYAFVPFGFFDDATASAGVEPFDEVVATIEPVEVPSESPADAPSDLPSMEFLAGDEFSLGMTAYSDFESFANEAPDQEVVETETADLADSETEAESDQDAIVEELTVEVPAEMHDVTGEGEMPVDDGSTTEEWDLTDAAEDAPVAVEVEPSENEPTEGESATEADIDVAAAHAKLDAIFGASFDESLAPARPAEPEISEEYRKPTPEQTTGESGDSVEVARSDEVAETGETATAGETVSIEGPLEAPEDQRVAQGQPAQSEDEGSSDEAPEGLEVSEFVDGTENIDVEVRTSVADEAPKPRGANLLTRVDSEGLWRHRTVPKAKLDDDVFTVTPNVGRVRVVFGRGESIDGRLHGVGQNKIVVDTKLGRISLDARRAERIDRLGSSKRVLATEEDSTRGLEKVRVKAPGGTFEGHLIARDGNRVTLRLDKGVRITLESDDIRPASKTGTVSRIKRIDQ